MNKYHETFFIKSIEYKKGLKKINQKYCLDVIKFTTEQIGKDDRTSWYYYQNYQARSIAFELLYDYKSALKDWTNAINWAPSSDVVNHSLYHSRGHLYWKMGFLKEAMADFRTCKLLDREKRDFVRINKINELKCKIFGKYVSKW